MNVDYNNMPIMSPIRIPTKDRSYFYAIYLWLMTTREWVIEVDWEYSIDGVDFIIPKGFVFDGASVPKLLRSWLSPMGILLIPGLIHDYGYKFAKLSPESKNINRKDCDQLFLNVAIDINGFRMLNLAAYFAIRLCGWLPWNAHRAS